MTPQTSGEVPGLLRQAEERLGESQNPFEQAVGKWIEDVLSWWVDPKTGDFHDDMTDPDGDPMRFEDSQDSHALAVARAYLNGGR